MTDFPYPEAEQLIVTRFPDGSVQVDEENIEDDDAALSLCAQAMKLITDEIFGESDA